MDQRVDINLRHTLRDMEGMETVEESHHAGVLRQEPDTLLLRYTAVSGEESKPAEVSLCLSGAEMSYRREGDSSVMVTYREGNDCDISYHTPYGALEMCIHTQWLRWSFDGRRGQISLHYRLLTGMEQELASETWLELTFSLREADV